MRSLVVTAVASVIFLAAAIIWFAVMGNPIGGEPTAVVVIDTERRPASAMETVVPKPRTRGGKTQETLRTDPGATTRARRPGGRFEPPPDVAVLNPVVPPGGAGHVPGARAEPGDGGHAELASVPVDALVENSRYGPLPKVADDGRSPSVLYARPIRFSPLPQTGEPARIAILVNGLGLSEVDTSRAIDKLPGAISLALGPYGSNLQNWVRRARARGHEILLELPLEPFDYPDNDPGPHTLLTNLSSSENLKRLRWVMAQFTGYVGLTNRLGTKFQAATSALSPILSEIRNRGLLYLDDGSAPRSVAGQVARQLDLGFTRAEITIDTEQTRAGVDRALAKLESLAKENGLAVAIGSGLPVTVEAIAEWSQSLKDKGLVLIPVSAAVLAQRQS